MELRERPEWAPPNVLLYGPEGSGKTSGACTYPGVKLLVNADKPNRTRFARSKRRDPHKLIMEPELPSFKKDSGEQPMLSLMREVMESVADPNNCIPDAVITDPIPEVYARLLKEFSNAVMDPNRDFRRSVVAYIRQYCEFLCELEHIAAIFVCQETLLDKGGEQEGLMVVPAVGSRTQSMAGLGPSLRQMVDIVGYCGVWKDDEDQVHYGAQLISEGGRTAKTGFACLGEYQPLDLAEWCRLIKQDEVDDAAFAGGSNVETASAAEPVKPMPDPTQESLPESSSSESTTPPGEQDSSESGSESSSSSQATKTTRSRGRKAAA